MADPILIVEDDIHTRKILQIKLEGAGFRVVSVSDGAKGWELLLSQGFQAAIVDLMLPGISGKELLAKLRKNESTRSMPVLVLTAKALEEDVIDLLAIGANDYMKKPFSPNEVLARLKGILSQSQGDPRDQTERKTRKFLVVGTGGVGGFFGGILSKAGHDVHFLARGAHLEALKEKGLRIHSTTDSWTVPHDHMVGRAEDAGPVDVVLFCVKAYDTEAAAKLLDPVLTPHSIILSLQNGIDNENVIRGIVSKGHVYGGVAYISARITAPGEITETGGIQRIVFGPLHGPIDKQAKEFHEMLLGAGLKAELRQEITGELWKKFIFISSMGSFTALTRLTHGEILESQPTLELVFEAMKEASMVARAHGVKLDPIDRRRIIEGLERFDRETRSSLYYDLINGKPLEVEALNGTVIRLADRYGLDVPIHKTIYAGLLPYHLKHQKRA